MLHILVKKKQNPERDVDEETQYEDDRHLKRRQTLNMEEKDNIKGKVETLREGKTKHSGMIGRWRRRHSVQKHSRDGRRGKTTGGWIVVERKLLCLL